MAKAKAGVPAVLNGSSDIDVRYSHAWGQSGVGDGDFREPMGVAVAMNGAIKVVEARNHRIQCFDVDGKFLRKWGSKGSADGDFDNPLAIAIAVCDQLQDSILIAMRTVPELYAFPPGVLPICTA